jgi:hypothetical protein
MKNGIGLLLITLLAASSLSAQEEGEKKWRVNGYLKNMQTLLLFNKAYPTMTPNGLELVDTFIQDNLVHHRFNVEWRPHDRWRFRGDLRNRIFFGDLVKATPNYAALIDNVNNDYFNLSRVLIDNPSLVAHGMIDRLYAEYSHEQWEVRLGRQRINWGIGTVWNPNDIFNAFAFTDFDYEERPGSDALRVKRYTGFAGSVELAAKMFDTWDEAVIAGMWRFNRWTYDFQLLAGLMERDLALGGGWAGNLGNAGLKGEMTYFLPMKKAFANYQHGRSSFALTLGIDYNLSNGLYLNSGYLFNSNGAARASATELFAFELSAKNLYPYRHAVFGQGMFPFTPLFNGGLAFIYSPVTVHALFLNPVATLSIAQNWDLDFVGQLVFNRVESKGYAAPVQALFFRLKWSY